ncbi:MAG: rRNA maturation RNase YbeY [Lachnospiraceae bacterium]|nr:rRNA maturation RNase YbeY [Lachnospiraceae bacterium]QUO32673.1 rRNA maturation RNase YbeY [Faecalicatena sp. Marseille-Q4148]
MTLLFEEEGDLQLPLETKELAEEVIEAALDYEGCPYEATVSLLLTMNNEIQEMNRNFREIDRATDVLSFPMIAYEEAGTFDFLEEDDSAFDPESGELVLGDIVISKERVIAQAEEYGHSIRREYAFLIAHSMLHLMGYDHMEEEERAVMEQKQRDILEQLGITR